MKYGINNVVGGFGRALSPEEALPYVLARTYREHEQLRNRLPNYADLAVDFGCGYGRNIPVLQETYMNVIGIERDVELVSIAKTLYPDVCFENVKSLSTTQLHSGTVDVLLTYTVLQHIPDSEIQNVCDEIIRLLSPGGTAIIVEETDSAINASEVTGRSVEQYINLFKKLEFVAEEDRVLENGNHYKTGGKLLVFRK